MTFPSRTIAIVAAALALSSVGSAFAQDRFQPRGPDRDGRYEQRDQRGFEGRRFDDRRDPHDRRDGRDRQDFRDGRQFDRHGFASPRAEWRRGGRVPNEYRGRHYVVNDWRGHHLHAPPRGYQWVGVGGDYVLAAIATGLIAQIIAGQ